MEMREQEHRRGKTPIEALGDDWTFSLLTEMLLGNKTEMDIIEDFFTIMLKTQKKDGGFNTLNATIRQKAMFRARGPLSRRRKAPS